MSDSDLVAPEERRYSSIRLAREQQIRNLLSNDNSGTYYFSIIEHGRPSAANRNRNIRPYSRTVLHAVTVPSAPKIA